MYIDNHVLKEIAEGKSYCFFVLEANRTEVILGRSCREELDVRVENCKQDNVPILKRAGGGGSVVLSKGIVVISIAGKTPIPFHLKEHMIVTNEIIISVLRSFGVRGLSIKGVSDIAIENRKIFGSSLYRKKDIILYQGSLLVDPEMSIFERYLKHPQKEPYYRFGRSHRDFMTSLYNEGYIISKKKLINAIKAKLSEGPPWVSLKQPLI